MNKSRKNPGWQSLCSPLPSVKISQVLPSDVTSSLTCVLTQRRNYRNSVLKPGGGFAWVGIGRKSICRSWRRCLSRLKRGLQLRAAVPGLPSHWAGGRGREDSGCGTWVLSSLGSLVPVSACTPAEIKPRVYGYIYTLLARTHTWHWLWKCHMCNRI